jgi:hypothetical protein
MTSRLPRPAGRAGGLPGDTTVPGHSGNLFPGVASALARHGFQVVPHRQGKPGGLGQLAEPALTKDAIAGRIRRLLALADGAPWSSASRGPRRT